MFIKLKRRELNLLILCCIIIAAAIGYIFVIEPVIKQYAFLKGEIEQKQLNFLKLQRVCASKGEIDTWYTHLLPRLFQSGSDEENFAFFLKEIELISRQASVYITNLKPLSILKESGYKEYLVRVEAEGRLNSLADFLYNLPDSEQIVSLKQLQIINLSQQEENLQFQMNLGRMIIVGRKDEK